MDGDPRASLRYHPLPQRGAGLGGGRPRWAAGVRAGGHAPPSRAGQGPRPSGGPPGRRERAQPRAAGSTCSLREHVPGHRPVFQQETLRLAEAENSQGHTERPNPLVPISERPLTFQKVCLRKQCLWGFYFHEEKLRLFLS